MPTYTIATPSSPYLIAIPFSFLSEEDVKVKRLDNFGIYNSVTYNNDTQWNNNLSNGYPVSNNVYRVVLGTEVGLGVTDYYVQLSRSYTGVSHIVYRDTPTYVPSFVNGSALTAEDLNSAFLRLSYQAEEKDQIAIGSSNVNLDGKFDKTGGTISGATTISANLSMNNNRIENVANPVLSNQVATKEYVDLANSAGGTPTILADTITATELSKVAGAEAVTTATIRDLNVTAGKLATDAVTNTKLADGAVTTAKLGAGLTINFAGNSIRCADDGTTNPLWESATTSTSNALNFRRPVTTNSIRALAITTAKVADGAITEPKLATDSVSTNKIVNLNVTGDKIADSTITSAKLLTSGLSFTSGGALTAQATSVASLTSSGDISAPSWTNHKLTNNWSNLDPSNDFISGFSLEYYPQYPGGVINVSAPPLTRKIKASPYPARIVISQRHWNNVASISTMQTWLTRKFNVIDFNNTNFFTLNNDGSVTFNGVGAVGTWLVEGFMQFFWQTTLGNLKGYSRVAGPAYLKQFDNITERETYYNPTQFSSSSVAFFGTSCYANTGSHDPKSLFKGVIHIQNSSPQTFSIQHWVASTQNASVGYRDPAGSPTSPFFSSSERNTFAGATFTKISDNYEPFIG